MNKTILICLAAVVVAIVIIALAALRFLRADDADPFDEIPEEPRRPSRAHEDGRSRDAIPAGATAMRSSARPTAERPARNSGYSDPGHSDPGYRDRPGPDRAPERRAGPNGGQPRSAPAPAMSSAGRPAKAGRAAAKGDGPDWDTMSDVDYWAELAADKPFNAEDATSAPAARASRRRGAEQPTGPRGAGHGDAGAQLPTRSRQPRPAAASAGPAHAPGRYAAEPTTESIAALARLANQPASPQPSVSQPRNSQPPSIQRPTPQPISQPHQLVRPLPAPLDDDPLTSPSFPAINTSDSRSYRTSRPSDGRPSDPRPSDPRADRRPPAAASYNEPTQQFTAYPPAAARANGAPPNSAPGGYPVQSAAAPAGNPYGSFVSQPPVRQDPGYAAYDGQPTSSSGGGYYPPSNGYLPATPVPNGGFANGGFANGGAPNGGAPNGYDANGYDQASYQALQPDAAYHQPSYQAVQYDQAGYGQDPAYARDAYPGYPGYGTGGY
jgi:hypothetical protein